MGATNASIVHERCMKSPLITSLSAESLLPLPSHTEECIRGFSLEDGPSQWKQNVPNQIAEQTWSTRITMKRLFKALRLIFAEDTTFRSRRGWNSCVLLNKTIAIAFSPDNATGIHFDSKAGPTDAGFDMGEGARSFESQKVVFNARLACRQSGIRCN